MPLSKTDIARIVRDTVAEITGQSRLGVPGVRSADRTCALTCLRIAQGPSVSIIPSPCAAGCISWRELGIGSDPVEGTVQVTRNAASTTTFA
jgi:hypothetical protein